MNKSVRNVSIGIAIVLGVSVVIACNGVGSSGPTANKTSSRSVEDTLLGTSASFAVFGGGAGVTNQGIKTVITGDMGTTGASTMITGFHSSDFVYTETPSNVGLVTGSVFTDAPHGTPLTFGVANSVAADALHAFNYFASLPNGTDPGAGQLGGLTLEPGTYKSASGAFLITGKDLTLDAKGNPDAVWVFQMASSLTVGTPTEARSVILTNGAQSKNVYWQVGSAATINGAGGGIMVGTIIASAGITFSTAGNEALTTLNGRALALFASITMVNTQINVNGTVEGTPAPVDSTLPITVTGTKASDVAPTIFGIGKITVENNGAHVAATLSSVGGGAINIANNGGVLTATETGEGKIIITNSGGVLTATNTGNGVMTINSNATGAVTVTNTGNGNITVNATGAAAVTVTHTGDADYTYP